MASVGRAAPGAEHELLEPGSPRSAALARRLRAVARRVRVQRALAYSTALSIASAGIAALALCWLKLGRGDLAVPWLVLAAGLPVAGVLAGALRPVPALLAARLIDRALGRPDLIASAWWFGTLAPAERSPFMNACMRTAEASADAVDARSALPIRAPRALRPALLLALGVVALGALEIPVRQRVSLGAPAHARLLHQDDVQAFQQDVAPLLEARAADPFVQETARELNALLEALHEGELERAEALSALRGLEKKLELSALGEDDEALREALREVGRALDRDPLAKSVAQAMQDADAGAARKQLEQLAESLREGGQRKEALRALAKKLERAAKPPAQDDPSLRKARDEVDRLLKKKAQAQTQDEREQRLLQKKQRELERLERKQAQKQRAERTLDRMRRELSQAGPALQGNRGDEAGDRLDEAAQQLAQAQQQQLSAEQRAQLREKLAQLRELISKQRGQGQAQRGGGGKSGAQGGQGQRLDLDRFARLSRGQNGPGGQKPGEQPGGAPNGKPGAKLLVPGQGGEPDAMLQLPGQQGQPSSGGEPTVIEDSPAGEGGRPDTTDPTRLQSTRVDTRVQGEQGTGATRSEVILEAGQRGFVSRGYERVHGEYERHAEAVLERDHVPGGYRFYVRRYFQLIRPREGEP